MLLHLSLHLLPDENLCHSVVYIILMSVSFKPELTIIITCIYKSAFAKLCVVLYLI